MNTGLPHKIWLSYTENGTKIPSKVAEKWDFSKFFSVRDKGKKIILLLFTNLLQ